MTMRAPGGSNTYIPSFDATGNVIEFTRSEDSFRLNQYVKYIPVQRDQGYVLTLDADEPYRIVSPSDYLWEDGADAPNGNDQRLESEFKPYRTVRVVFPYNVGSKAVAQATWEVMAAHARKTVTKAMTLRTLKVAQLLTNPANWPSASVVAPAGSWYSSTTTQAYIQQTINNALVATELATGGTVTDEDSFRLVMNPNTARKLSSAPEFKDYLKGSPDAYASITDYKNQNRKYGLAPYVYGVKTVVENAVRVTTRKSGVQARSFVWPDNVVCLVSRPEGLVADESAAGLDFSTVALRFYEENTVETKSDPDNRREMGRIVEDYAATMQAATTGSIITLPPT